MKYLITTYIVLKSFVKNCTQSSWHELGPFLNRNNFHYNCSCCDRIFHSSDFSQYTINLGGYYWLLLHIPEKARGNYGSMCGQLDTTKNHFRDHPIEYSSRSK